MEASRRRAGWEILAVLLTGLVFLVFENVFHLKIPFLIGCTLAWAGYLAWRLRKEPAIARDWGLRSDTLKPATRICGVMIAVGVAALLAFRLAAGWKPLPAASIVVFAIYPIWGFIQQFVLQALVAGNLERLGVARWTVVVVTASLFGLAHLPDWPLVGLTATAGIACTSVFLRTRNLVPLAFVHAWLGTLAYYWILERDPWLEMFPR